MTYEKKHSRIGTYVDKKIVQGLEKRRNYAAKKFPLGFALVATLGLVMTMQGYQALVTKIPFISHNPWISFVAGLVILLATGTLYKKLG